MSTIILSALLIGWGSLLPEKTYITNTFGTYRPGRFHTGIDFSTHGRVGIPLKTPFKSQVWRLFVSYYGYGKTLYLSTPEDKIVVLAHLSGFPSHLEDLLLNLQISKQSYFVDHFPTNTITINKGEIAAFTGKSGVGSPHLHLEVRTHNNKPVNPLFFLKIHDTRPPKILKIRVIPRSIQTIVDNSLWGKDYYPQKRNSPPGGWSIPKNVSVTGPFGIEIKVIDYIDGSPYKLLPYKILVYLSGDLVYHLEFDTVNFSESWLSPIVFSYDSGSYSSSWIRLYRLGDMVPGVVKFSKNYLTVSEQDSLLIEISDFEGNLAYLKVFLSPSSNIQYKQSHSHPKPTYKGNKYAVFLNPYHAVVYLYSEDDFLFKEGELLNYRLVENGRKVVSISEPGLYYIGAEDIPILLHKLSPGGDTIQYQDWTIVFSRYSIPESTWIFLKEVNIDIPKGLKGSGKGLVIMGGGMPILKRFEVFHNDIGGLYKLTDKGVKFVNQGGVSWGIYTFLEDTLPPKIHVKSRNRILVKIVDNESGIDGYTLKVFVDDKWVPAEYDPDDGMVTYDKKLSNRPHQVKVFVSDRAGNESSISFRVSP